MRIYLFLDTNIITFTLPKKVYGNFRFGIDDDDDNKLINVEARDNKWILYSTIDSNVCTGDSPISEVELVAGQFYNIVNNDITYLIYVTNMFDNTFSYYNIYQDFTINIGKSNKCNLNYNISLVDGVYASLFKKGDVVTFNVYSDNIYLNDNRVELNLDKKNSYTIDNGDTINIFGLRILYFGNTLLINNPFGLVNFNPATAGVNIKQLDSSESPIEVEFKDENLYKVEDFFTKSPRFRRQITTKHIDFTTPPGLEKTKDMPALLTVGPMLTMGAASLYTFANTLMKIVAGESTVKDSMSSIISGVTILCSMFLWPILTKIFDKYNRWKNNRSLVWKYNKYLKKKKKEFELEYNYQKDVLIENLISLDQCLDAIDNGKLVFWDRKNTQNDFLNVRVGTGDSPLDVEINFPEDDFAMEEDVLKDKANELLNQYKNIKDVPVSYSFYKHNLTAIMGIQKKAYGFLKNVILQLLTFYSYDDLRIVVFTNQKNAHHWDYIRYLNYNFNNDRSLRFFSSEDDYAKALGDYFNNVLNYRIALAGNNQNDEFIAPKPYYLIITDDYTSIKRNSFIKNLCETSRNVGFSFIMIEKNMSNLPSNCSNFISFNENSSDILTDSFENQERRSFKEEINYSIDMMKIARKLSNIPIEFDEGTKQLPESITFLEMEHVGKVEQLNIMNRWESNDSTTSLKAEVGVDVEGKLMYLDLHEKFHGPHGLVAGMTGSGKSEFIITYILSLAMNYSPNDVSFILIDYKGGGLAFAFENKTTGVVLPHLAGTITNLDKAEMDRTLVSINSEVKRRQRVFNEARDQLGESTIDIYKYQRYFHEGRLKNPVSHLFIICDEFAELKSQQPDFMDNLISIARIGRSLGVHLILATQKPSGVVNDQIWSNSKFRVCLKVQDESDSKEMLKRGDAAGLKQTGRFFLQVGYDEYFALGQSGWCGAKYFPSDTIVKQEYKGIDFINDVGNVIKSIQAGKKSTVEAQGEQLAAIMNSIIEVSKTTGIKADRLWLDNIPEYIFANNLATKYDFKKKDYNVEAIIGEYDAPEKQEQGILVYSMKENGNTILYGSDDSEKEKFLQAVLYFMCTNYSPSELNIYIMDFGSEFSRTYYGYPQIGGSVYIGDDESYKNLMKMISEEIVNRKKLLISYGGSIDVYNSKNEKKLPQILVMINNYDALLDVYADANEEFSVIARDCERYGIALFVSCTSLTCMGRRLYQSFANRYSMKLNDTNDYFSVFNIMVKNAPRDMFGRGYAYIDEGIHEFQTVSIVDENHMINDELNKSIAEIKNKYTDKARGIPVLPDKVTFEFIKEYLVNADKLPIGIAKESLKPARFAFNDIKFTSILSNKIEYSNFFVDSLIDLYLRINGIAICFIDGTGDLEFIKDKVVNNRKVNYYGNNYDKVLDVLCDFDKNALSKNYKVLYVIYGLEKLKNNCDSTKLDNLLKSIKSNDNSFMIIFDSGKSLKSVEFESWFSSIKNNTDGIWIGSGFGEQSNFRLSKIGKDAMQTYPKDYGFVINDGIYKIVKLLNFGDLIVNEDDEDEQ